MSDSWKEWEKLEQQRTLEAQHRLRMLGMAMAFSLSVFAIIAWVMLR